VDELVLLTATARVEKLLCWLVTLTDAALVDVAKIVAGFVDLGIVMDLKFVLCGTEVAH